MIYVTLWHGLPIATQAQGYHPGNAGSLPRQSYFQSVTVQLVCFYSQWISKQLRKIGNLKICIRNECFLLLCKGTLHIWSESKQVGGISTAFSHLEGANSILKHHRHIHNFFTRNLNASYVKEGKTQNWQDTLLTSETGADLLPNHIHTYKTYPALPLVSSKHCIPSVRILPSYVVPFTLHPTFFSQSLTASSQL